MVTSQARMRSLTASSRSKSAWLMERVRSRRWPSPSCTEKAASRASSMTRSTPARFSSASELGSAALFSRALRFRKVRRRSSSSRVMMPSLMAEATPCFHLSSRACSISSSVARERWAMADRDCRRTASLKEWSVAAWATRDTISCQPALWVSRHFGWSRWKMPACWPQ